MCRSKSESGRRCPCRADPERRRVESARQRVSRYARWCDAATDVGDMVAAAKYDRLMASALADLDEPQSDPQQPESGPVSRADEFTVEKTADWSDERLEQVLSESWDDPAAVDQLMHVIDLRQSEAELRESMTATRQHAQAWASRDPWDTADSALTNPERRPASRLSAKERARVEFDTYVDCQYMQAETDCRGVLMTAEGYERGVDPRSLFQGPLSRAEKWASEELLSWWGKHGRLNFAAFRYQMLGYESDREAAARVKMETFDMVPAWSDEGVG